MKKSLSDYTLLDTCSQKENETSKLIKQNYIVRCTTALTTIDMVSLYNKLIDLKEDEEVQEEIRKQLHKYVSLLRYKIELVTTSPENNGIIIMYHKLFEDAYDDDENDKLSVKIRPRTRSQRMVRNREFMLCCTAVLVGIKFDKHDLAMKFGKECSDHGMFT